MMGFRLQRVQLYQGGYTHVGYDKELVTEVGAAIRLEGTAGAHKALVVKHLPERKLLAVKNFGYTSYVDRGTGNAYSPARFTIYEYEEIVRGNEVHLVVDLFGIMELPLGWKPEHVRKD